MTFWTVRRPFGDSAARFIGVRKVTKTLNFSMPVLRKGGKRIPFWGFGTRMVFGVKARKLSQPLQYLILRKSTLPPLPLGSMKLLMQSLGVSQKK